MVCKIQGLTRGFIARNAFYMMMKQKSYTPQNEDMRKRLIGFKLGLISKKQAAVIQKQREQAGLIDKMASKNIQSTEQLLESFLPNV